MSCEKIWLIFPPVLWALFLTSYPDLRVFLQNMTILDCPNSGFCKQSSLLQMRSKVGLYCVFRLFEWIQDWGGLCREISEFIFYPKACVNPAICVKERTLGPWITSSAEVVFSRFAWLCVSCGWPSFAVATIPASSWFLSFRFLGERWLDGHLSTPPSNELSGLFFLLTSK